MGAGSRQRAPWTRVGFVIGAAGLLSACSMAAPNNLSSQRRGTTTVPSSSTTSPTSTTYVSTSQTSIPASSVAANPRLVLPPAVVPPVSDECTESLDYAQDGNVGPATCPNGGVNVWASQTQASCVVGKSTCPTSQTLALGRDPSASEVIQAMCWDYYHVSGTNPITLTDGTLASAYYGWAGAAKNAAEAWASQNDCPGALGYSGNS